MTDLQPVRFDQAAAEEAAHQLLVTAESLVECLSVLEVPDRDALLQIIEGTADPETGPPTGTRTTTAPPSVPSG